MSSDRYKRRTRFLNYVMTYLMLVPVFLLLLYAFADMSLAWTLLLSAGAILLSFFLQEYCHRFFLYTLGNLLILLITVPAARYAGIPDHFELSRIPLFLAYLLFAVILIVFGYVTKLQKKQEFLGKNFPLPAIAVPIIVQFIFLSLKADFLLPWVFASALLLIALRFLNQYLIGYTAFFEEARSASEVPMGQIISSNSWLLTAFFSVSALVMIISCILPVGNLISGSTLSSLGQGIARVIRFLAALISRLFGSKQQSDELLSDENPSLDPNMGMLGTEEASPFWLFMEHVMMYVVLGILVLGFIALILYGVSLLLKNFYSRRALSTDKVEFLNPFDKKEKLVHTEKATQGFFERLFSSSADGRIRRIFYKTVKHRSVSVETNLAPVELTRKIVKQDNELSPAAALSALYEKARYSQHDCTKEDIAAAKKQAELLK